MWFYRRIIENNMNRTRKEQESLKENRNNKKDDTYTQEETTEIGEV